MEIIPTAIEGVVILEPHIFRDSLGIDLKSITN